MKHVGERSSELVVATGDRLDDLEMTDHRFDADALLMEVPSLGER